MKIKKEHSTCIMCLRKLITVCYITIPSTLKSVNLLGNVSSLCGGCDNEAAIYTLPTEYLQIKG